MQGFQLHERAESVPTETSYILTDWQKGYRSLPHEYSYEIDEVDGKIPVDLKGTLFRNGPGLLDVNGERLHHPFDGDGMVCSIAFDKGRAYFRNRFVRTEGYCAEQKAGRLLYRGVFGTQKPGGWLSNFLDLRLKNIANTQVIYWGGKLLALWEAAEPHRLDPRSLETIGREYLDGVLHPGSAFAAHPWIDPETQTLVNFAIKPGLSTTITIYELDVAGKVIREHAHAVPGFAFIHDFAITPNYCILFQNPVAFNPIPFAIGLRGAGECLKFQPNKPTQIIVIPRDGKSPVQIVPTQSGFVFHHSNAFEQDGAVWIDSICYEAFPAVDPNSDYREVDFDALSPGHLYRFRIDLESKTVDRQLLESRCCEFPYVHPSQAGRPYRYVYMAAAHRSQGNAPLQAILKADLETGDTVPQARDRQLWSAAPHGYVGEPIFVPRAAASYQNNLPAAQAVGDEDDGWVLTLVYDSKRERSDLVILDAKNMQEPIARLHLKHHVPYGLHGSFTPEFFGAAS